MAIVMISIGIIVIVDASVGWAPTTVASLVGVIVGLLGAVAIVFIVVILSVAAAGVAMTVISVLAPGGCGGTDKSSDNEFHLLLEGCLFKEFAY